MANKNSSKGEVFDPKLISFEDFIKITKPQIPIGPKRQATFNRSSFLIEQTLHTKKASSQLSLPLYDTLLDTTKAAISHGQVDIDWVNENGVGFNPTGSERLMLLAVSQLLHEKSQNQDRTKINYYAGNEEAPLGMEKFNDGRPTSALRFTLFELAKIYTGKKNPSGKEQQNVQDIIVRLAKDESKRVLFRYKREVKDNRGKEFVETIESFGHIWTIVGYKLESKTDASDVKKDTFIVLNPIFRDQLDKMWVTTPLDIIPRLQQSYGSKKISDVTLSLFDKLNREYSLKNFHFKIGLHEKSDGAPGLFWLIGETYMKASRRSVLEDHFYKAVATMKGIGLVLDFEIQQSATAGEMAVFTLNTDWFKLRT